MKTVDRTSQAFISLEYKSAKKAANGIRTHKPMPTFILSVAV